MYFKRIFCIMISVHILFITPTYQTEIDLHTQKNDAEIATMISVDRTESTTVEDEVVDIDHKLLKGFKELYKHIMGDEQNATAGKVTRSVEYEPAASNSNEYRPDGYYSSCPCDCSQQSYQQPAYQPQHSEYSTPTYSYSSNVAPYSYHPNDFIIPYQHTYVPPPHELPYQPEHQPAYQPPAYQPAEYQPEYAAPTYEPHPYEHEPDHGSYQIPYNPPSQLDYSPQNQPEYPPHPKSDPSSNHQMQPPQIEPALPPQHQPELPPHHQPELPTQHQPELPPQNQPELPKPNQAVFDQPAIPSLTPVHPITPSPIKYQKLLRIASDGDDTFENHARRLLNHRRRAYDNSYEANPSAHLHYAEPSHVACGQNLLISCAPTVAAAPCVY